MKTLLDDLKSFCSDRIIDCLLKCNSKTPQSFEYCDLVTRAVTYVEIAQHAIKLCKDNELPFDDDYNNCLYFDGGEDNGSKS